MQALDPWSHGVHGALHAVARKVATLPETPTELAIRRYFAGEKEGLLAMTPVETGVVPRVSQRLDRPGADDTGGTRQAWCCDRATSLPRRGAHRNACEIDGGHRVVDIVSRMFARRPP